MPLTPEEMRALFPITRRYAYLDHAAIAPLATPVRSTMEVFLTRQSEEPFEREHWERLRGQVRNRVAELVATRPESKIGRASCRERGEVTEGGKTIIKRKDMKH